MKHPVIEGITIAPPRRQVTNYGTYSKTAVVVIRPNQQIQLTPFGGCTAWQDMQNRAVAERIWMFGRQALDADCWRYVDGLGWVVTIFVREPRTIAEREAAIFAEAMA